MVTPHRPDPDALLARVKDEEAKARRGRLKVFLGAAPGVGKTYTMLEAARAVQADGVDVVAGLVETHGRPETEVLLRGLPVLPRKTIEYRGTVLTELDLDGTLARRPQVALVDELAHTNAPGSRHAKRWQDVEELLAAGIHVYTTLNVQHLESLNDVVAQITGVVVRETVPDAVFERADEVELVDVSAEVLLERLREGKVYVPEQAARALEHFFRKGNLIALRELALRCAADRVDAQMRGYRAAHGIERTWPAGERVLVCIGPNPASARLIRAGRRMAAALHADWVVLHIASNRQRLSASDRDDLTANLRLAERLGAETVTLTADDVAPEILAYARAQNVTRIIVGKPTHARWRDRLFGPLLDQLIRGSREIDVYVITGEADGARPTSARPEATASTVTEYLRAAAVVAGAAGVGLAVRPWVSEADVAMLFLLAVMLIAAWSGARVSVLASVVSIAVFDFLFVPPYYTFAVARASYLLTFAVMLVVALLISSLVARIRGQAVAARGRERHTAALYALSRDLARGRDTTELAEVVKRHARRWFGAEATVLLPEALERDGVAQWVFAHSRPAGTGTDTLSGAGALYLPLRASEGTIGVLRAEPDDPPRLANPVERQLVEAVADQAAVAIERALLAERTAAARVEAQAEQLRSALLSSLSHDLRTPLAGIEGAASTLLAETLEPPARRELLGTIQHESRRMMRLINNLLDMVRVESGSLQAQKEWQSVEEIVGVALVRLEDSVDEREVITRIPTDLPLVAADGLLIEQVIVNLLENALKYAPRGTPIEITAAARPDDVTVCVADRGPGLPPGEEGRLFDKFYRAPSHAPGAGAGLGLTICRAIVTAHGGRIWAEPREGGGARFCFTLPRAAEPPAAPEAPPQ